MLAHLKIQNKTVFQTSESCIVGKKLVDTCSDFRKGPLEVHLKTNTICLNIFALQLRRRTLGCVA